ncbi:MAG: DUF58 domain-containing protein [Defluviitaleaceae bacterium]|nr:DUF58 domain-containing protein [Defluviitaleaceae bacterium]
MLKNRLTYLAVVVVLGLLIYLHEDGITYMAFYAVLALPLVSLALTLVSRRQFTVEEQLTQNNIIKNEMVQYVFNVRNNSFLPCASVRVRFRANSFAVVTDFVDQYFAILPYKSHEIVFNVSARYRGNYEIGVLNIVMYDFLGLFRFEQKHDKTLTLMVRPRVLDMSPLPLSTAESGMENVKNLMAQEDYAVISDLRKYQPTDGYKKIHWKASAKKNELISKNYQHTRRNSTAVVVDNSLVPGDAEAALALEDAVMEGCVSTLAYCLRRQQLCSLHYMGSDDQQSPGITGNFEYLFTVASGITFGNFEDFGTYFANYAKMQVDAENLIVLTQNINDQVLAAAQSLCLFGNNVIIFYFNNPAGDDLTKIARLNEMGVHCIDFKTKL